MNKPLPNKTIQTKATVGDTIVRGFVPGAVGGTCSVLVGHPIDLVKVRMQTTAGQIAATVSDGITTGTSKAAFTPTQVAEVVVGGEAAAAAAAIKSTGSSSLSSPGTIRMLRTIFATEGMAGLYAGVTAPLLAVTPAFAITFFAYESAKQALLARNRDDAPSSTQASKVTIPQAALAGGYSGIWLALVVGPLDRFKCLMQVDKSRYRSFGDCVRQVYNDGGVRSVLRGTGLTVLRDVPGNAAYFGGYELTRRTLLQWEGRSTPSPASTLLAGGMAGVANWIVAIPIDTVKSRWQTSPVHRYRNVLHVVTDLLSTDGVTGFFKGLSPALLRAFSANAACLLGVETTRTLIATLLDG